MCLCGKTAYATLFLCVNMNHMAMNERERRTKKAKLKIITNKKLINKQKAFYNRKYETAIKCKR